jgi:steroid 5-alpha reductase family enzyme
MSLAVLIPLLVICLILFLKLLPQNADMQKIKSYNLGTILVAILLSVIFAVRVRASMINGSDEAWWPVIGIIFAPVIMIETIFVSGLIRNFIVFRNKK